MNIYYWEVLGAHTEQEGNIKYNGGEKKGHILSYIAARCTICDNSAP